MARFFSSGAIEFGPWSPSKAGVLKECPLKYIFQYVEKPQLTEENSIVQDDSALVMGSAVHKYAENLAEGQSNKEAELYRKRLSLESKKRRTKRNK